MENRLRGSAPLRETKKTPRATRPCAKPYSLRRKALRLYE